MQRGCRLPRGSQDRLYKESTDGTSSTDVALGHLSSVLLCAALPYIVLLDFIRVCYLAVLIVSGLLDVDYFFGKLAWTGLW